MVVRRGEDWGRLGTPQPGTPVARNDAHAGQLIHQGIREFILASGDLARTVGASVPSPDCSYRRLSIDLMKFCLLDSREVLFHHIAMSHCLIRPRFLKGGLLRDRITVISNSQYMHGRDVAPRGHPNDGKFEIVEFSEDLSVRQRLLVLQKLKTGDHLPHPSIRFRQISQRTSMDVQGIVALDGRRVGHRVVKSVEPLHDEAVVWIAVPIGLLETQD